MLAAALGDRVRVLVVDDDVDTIGSAAMVLRLQGYDVETASTGQGAVEQTARFQPEIAMIDLAMPGMDGYEAARQIQRLALPKPPVLVAISGWAHADARLKSAEAGFDLHLGKPVEPQLFEELQLLVERFDAKLTQLRDLRQRQQQLLSQLLSAHVQMGYALLQVLRTTEDGVTRDRCVAKAQKLCSRLTNWVVVNPNLHHMRNDVEYLVDLLWGHSPDSKKRP